MRFYHKAIAAFAAAASLIGAASAATVWTDWTSATVATAGSATGTLNGVGVSYAGQVNNNTNITGTSGRWLPASSYIGGSVDAGPSTPNDIITLTGGTGTGVNTVTFASPIENPVFAIWSLGQTGIATNFTFINATPTFQAGGAGSQFGGSAIMVSGNVVTGVEGNGVVIFLGTFSSISWTNPVFENFYGFTIGSAGPTNGTGVVPVPGALILLATGLAGLGAARRSRAKSAD